MKSMSNAAPSKKTSQDCLGSDMYRSDASRKASDLRLFSFGSNSLGQLSHGSSLLQDAHSPTEVSLPSSTSLNSISIVAGGNHTFLLSHSDNVVYSVGDNTFGQCGIPSNEAIEMMEVPGRTTQRVSLKFSPVNPPNKDANWETVSAGWQFSLLLSSENKLYACGNGPRGELGLGLNMSTAFTPAIIPSFPPLSTRVKRIVSGVEHSLALLSNGHIYGWGNGRKGQLGVLEGKDKFLWNPTKINLPSLDFESVDIAAGREFSALISREGDVLVFGSDKWNVISSNPFTRNPGWRSFGTGWGAIFILSQDGKVTSWGRNTHGQLPPDGVPPLIKLAVGSEHTIGLGEDGKVFIWGWGEHGNCGPLKEGEGEVVRWKNEVKINEDLVEGGYKIEGIAAGCATSWIWLREIKT